MSTHHQLTPETLVEQLGNMSVMQLCELTRALEDKWGVKAVPMAAPISTIPGTTTTSVQEEQTEFSVVITAVGDKRIDVIKALRGVLGLGLAEAKTWVESVNGPKVVKEGLNKADADAIVNDLTAAGAKVELK